MITQFPEGPDRVTVLFQLSAQIWADKVHLVGDFNGWSRTSTPMRHGELFWEAWVTLEAGGRYGYAYLLDGADWRTDFAPSVLTLGERLWPCTLLPIESEHAQHMLPIR